jgi:carbonic anhydrase
MRLFEAILEANHRAVAGDRSAGLHIADYATELPLVALTCIDPRLNRFFPGVLGLSDEQFIWLRNAGNIITDPDGTTMRSLALACAVKGGREIAIIGHTDCRVRHTSISQLIDLFKAQGIPRTQLPENLAEYFGVFASEHQNVLRAVEMVRQSPLIGPAIPVQGLLVSTDTGKVDWIVNGYEALARPTVKVPAALQMPSIGALSSELGAKASAGLDALKNSETKIGDAATRVSQWAIKNTPTPAAPAPAPLKLEPSPAPAALPPQPVRPKPIPIPPRIEPPAKSGRYRT